MGVPLAMGGVLLFALACVWSRLLLRRRERARRPLRDLKATSTASEAYVHMEDEHDAGPASKPAAEARELWDEGPNDAALAAAAQRRAAAAAGLCSSDGSESESDVEAAAERGELEVEIIDLNEIGFTALKKKLIERGVPEELVHLARSKFMLKEVASSYPTCKITFLDDLAI